MSQERILVLDDDSSIRRLLSDLLREAGYEVKTASDIPQAIEAVKKQFFHLCLVDVYLPGGTGLEVLKEIRAINSQALSIVMTAHGTIELGVKAMKAGAFDCVSKPFQNDAVLMLVKNALEFQRLKSENLALQKTVRGKYRFESIVGLSPAMQSVLELIEKVTDSDSTILIHGESGTGKEVIARTLHYNGPRQERPFVAVNCGAIPETLLESEMFGHEKGAFTGATSSRIGRFESAHGGTLFLDEIGEMPLPLQVKLLRALQEREFERVGGNKTVRVDARIIAATNQDLEAAVGEKRFRKDLFYRLNVIPLHLPPLRERKEDIPLLIQHFLDKLDGKNGRKWESLSPEARETLLSYTWPGNVRELENLIERLVTLKPKGPITVEDLPQKLIQAATPPSLLPTAEFPDGGVNLPRLVSQFEDHLIQQALIKTNGVKNQAAHLLGLKRTTLIDKLKKNRPHTLQ